jgi:signal transduction histidine kinase
MEAKTREFLNVCLGESLKLKGLFESLLDFSEITADRLRMKLERGVVAEVLRPYCEERVPGISEGMRELTLSVAADVPEAQFDRHRLIQIVDLLVDNAVKFTPRGTHIDIRVHRQTDAGREWIAVEVCDDGPGIPPESVATLFQLFRQGDGSLTRRVGGLGLGLSFARELAEKMGGRLDVDSELGSGSVFRLMLAIAA